MPDFGVHDAADAKGRHNAADPRGDADGPFRAHQLPPIRPRHRRHPVGAVVEIEAQQVQRRRGELHGGGRHELRARHAGDLPAQLLAHVAVEVWRQQGGHVEGGEDGHAVARGEEGVAGHGDGSGDDAGRAEHADKDLVLVDAHADVGGGRCEEFGRSRSDVRGRPVADSRGDGVDGVGREIGAAVKHEYQSARLREEDGLRSEEEGSKGRLDRGGEGVSTGGILHDGPEEVSKIRSQELK